MRLYRAAFPSGYFSRLLLTLVMTVQAVLAQPQVVPDYLKEALTEDSSATLLSIFPQPDPTRRQFLDYPVLGRVETTGNEAERLKLSVLKGLEQADLSVQESCFAPRHGLIAGEVRLLICYACHNVIAQSKDGKRTSLAITDAGQQELVQAVADHRLPWQGWQPTDQVMRHQSGLTVTVPDDYQAEGAAGTDTLYLRSRDLSVQRTPLPGTLILRTEDDTEQTVSTQWLDHSGTGQLVWYLVGSPSRYEKSENMRICQGPDSQLEYLKAQFIQADRPAELPARIRIRPVADEGDLNTQHHRLRRAGFALQDITVSGVDFKAARREKDGIELKVAVGVVPTKFGPVLVLAEIPLDLFDPLPALVLELSTAQVE